jgi:hypothetical protein
MVAQVEVQGIREDRKASLIVSNDAAVVSVTKPIELFGICDRRSPEYDSVHEREDRGVCAESEPKSNDGGDCEGFGLKESANRYTEVAENFPII